MGFDYLCGAIQKNGFVVQGISARTERYVRAGNRSASFIVKHANICDTPRASAICSCVSGLSIRHNFCTFVTLDTNNGIATDY
jgi:hypothetical protein